MDEQKILDTLAFERKKKSKKKKKFVYRASEQKYKRKKNWKNLLEDYYNGY